MRHYRYSSWDGTQDPFAVDADDLMDAMADDLASHGDLSQALRNLMRRGMQGQMGSGFEGLREMLERLKQQSRERLERYNLASMIDELKQRMDEILQMERSDLDGQAQPGQQRPADPQATPDNQASQSTTESGSAADQPQNRSPQQDPDGQPGRHGQQGSQTPLENAERQQRLQFLNQLPSDFAGRTRELNNYEFFNPEAQQAFDELMDMLKQQAMGNMFREMAQRLANMTQEELQRLKDMLADLNQMMDQQIWGEEPDFEEFMQKYGDMFGPNPPQNLEELSQQLASQIAQMQSLFNSLPDELQQELQEMMSTAFNDEALAAELAELQANLDFLSSDERQAYEFSGTENVPIEQAMRLMDELQKIDTLQEQLADVGRQGTLEDVDAEALEQILGPEGRRELEKLRELEQRLEEAGYLRRKGGRLELTPKGIRKIGLKALQDIFNRLKFGRHGGHRTNRHGLGIEAAHETKPYEYGDHFNLDLQQTVMNSVRRQGKGTPVHLQPNDFEVYKHENLNQCSTVLMLDQSRSMGLNGCFEAAKKVALALHSLIKMQYPRDNLYIIGFAEYANELLHEDIPTVSWGGYHPGTNMHHALMIARRLLGKHRYGQRQVLMITDGEPTAHLEQGLAYFDYPPSWRTIEQTLLEVKRCTKESIVINTFMMEQDPYLMRFIQEVTRINQGRAFFSSPHHLGEYIVTDYINNKRRRRIA
ncbi:MAG: VWA domain-containing protein [Candidatus Tectomicrobia bacterium]